MSEPDDRILRTLVRAERFLIRAAYRIPEILWYLFAELRWRLSSRSRMESVRIRSLDQVEWGRVHYVRGTPRNIPGFSVYRPLSPEDVWGEGIEDEETYDLQEIGIDEHHLSGRDNWEWIYAAAAREKGYTVDKSTLRASDEYPKDESLDFGESLDRYHNPEWVTENVPEEHHVVLADLGRDGIKAQANGVSNREYLNTLIQRGALYRVTDTRMLEVLKGYGLHDDPEFTE